MTGRRRTADPDAPAVTEAPTPHVAPPEIFDTTVLASTDPTEVPPPVGGLAPEPRVEDHRLVDDEPAEEVTEELSPEEQVMFSSLLTCGRRTKVLQIFDHTVVVQSLCGDDDLRVGMYARAYAGSLGEQRAYQIGVAAAGIRSINGAPFVTSLYDQAESDAVGVLFEQKATKMAKMYPSVIQRIYRGVLDAEKEFIELADRLGK